MIHQLNNRFTSLLNATFKIIITMSLIIAGTTLHAWGESKTKPFLQHKKCINNVNQDLAKKFGTRVRLPINLDSNGKMIKAKHYDFRGKIKHLSPTTSIYKHMSINPNFVQYVNDGSEKLLPKKLIVHVKKKAIDYQLQYKFFLYNDSKYCDVNVERVLVRDVDKEYVVYDQQACSKVKTHYNEGLVKLKEKLDSPTQKKESRSQLLSGYHTYNNKILGSYMSGLDLKPTGTKVQIGYMKDNILKKKTVSSKGSNYLSVTDGANLSSDLVASCKTEGGLKKDFKLSDQELGMLGRRGSISNDETYIDTPFGEEGSYEVEVIEEVTYTIEPDFTGGIQ